MSNESDQPTGPRDPRPGLRPAFVGRLRELELLDTLAENARDAQPRAVFLSGEPGIGKTQLVRTFLERSANGMLSLWGYGSEFEGVPALWPWVQVLRQCSTKLQGERLPAQATLHIGHLTRLAPDLRELSRPDVSSPHTGEPRHGFSLIDGIAQLMLSVSSLRPTVLLLDDLHAVDRSSCRVLDFLVKEISGREVPLLLVLVYRSDRHAPEWLRSSLGRVRSGLSVDELTLGPLERSNIRTMMERSGVQEPSEGLVARVAEQSEGNPLFAQELIRSYLRGEHTENLRSGGIAQLVWYRLSSLDEDAMQLLWLSASLGMEFHFEQLRAYCPTLPAEELHAALGSLVNGWLLRESDSGGYTFTHGLVQRAVYQQIPESVRARIHAEIAEACSDLRPSDASESEPLLHSAARARHCRLAEAFAGTSLFIEVLLRAGEAALDSHDYQSARESFEEALTQRPEVLDTHLAAESWFGVGRAHAGQLNPEEAIRCLVRAYDLFEAVDDRGSMVRVALFPVVYAPWGIGTEMLARRALHVPEPESIDAARLRVNLAQASYYQRFETRECRSLIDEALRIARAHGYRMVELEALLALSQVLAYELEADTGLSAALDAAEIANELEQDQLLSSAYRCAALNARIRGDVSAALRYIETVQELHPVVRDRYVLLSSHGDEVYVTIYAAAWERGRRTVAEGLAVDPHNEIFLAALGCIDAATGHPEEARGHCRSAFQTDRALHRSPAPTPTHAFLAGLTANAMHDTGDTSLVEPARHAAEGVLNAPRAAPYIEFIAVRAYTHIAALTEDRTLAEAMLGRLERLGSHATPPVDWGQVAAIAANLLGWFEDAIGYAEDSVNRGRQGGYGNIEAHALYEQAVAIRGLGRNEKDQRAAVRKARVAAERIADEPLKQAVAQLETGSETGGTSADGSDLTDREVEILQLIANGYTNVEIGGFLKISANTVRNHIARIYGKCGVANRAEAVSFARTHGIV